MKKIYTLIVLMSVSCSYLFSQVEGTWKIAPQEGSLAVGPELGSSEWWSIPAGDVDTRACFFDDEFVFEADGTFRNVVGEETWIEAWQGIAADGCAAPVAPHDGSAAATWSYDADAGTLTLTGVGAHLGIPKVINGAEITSPAAAPESVTYNVSIEGDMMVADIDFGGGWWRFILEKADAGNDVPDLTGVWNIAPQAAALAVGPELGSGEWWSNPETDVMDRACFFDDQFVFQADGTFRNVMGEETWLEAWQGVAADQCGAPVAPHDGSTDGTWSYDEDAGTLTLTGVGAHLGIPKVINDAEITNPADAPESITYNVTLEGDMMVADVNFGAGWWRFNLQKSDVSSVIEVVNNQFSVFPNPANSEVTISSNEKIETLTIRDISGKVMSTRQNLSLTETINIAGFTPGMYLLESRTGNQISIEKLIVY